MHIARNRVPISGASDHGVSEAFYLDDPEGNGIEVYNDRPRERWNWENGLVDDADQAARHRGDPARGRPATSTYPAAPDGTAHRPRPSARRHIERAEEFYRGAVGLDLTRRRGGATFMSSGGYHHHVGANVWHSDGAGLRDQRSDGPRLVLDRDRGSRARRSHRLASATRRSMPARRHRDRRPLGTRSVPRLPSAGRRGGRARVARAAQRLATRADSGKVIDA